MSGVKVHEKKRELNSLVKQAIAVESEVKQIQIKLNSFTEQKKELQSKLVDVMDTSDDEDFEISGEEYKRKIKRLELRLRDLNRKLKEISENNQLDIEANEKHDKMLQNLNDTKKSIENLQTNARECPVRSRK